MRLGDLVEGNALPQFSAIPLYLGGDVGKVIYFLFLEVLVQSEEPLEVVRVCGCKDSSVPLEPVPCLTPLYDSVLHYCCLTVTSKGKLFY